MLSKIFYSFSTNFYYLTPISEWLILCVNKMAITFFLYTAKSARPLSCLLYRKCKSFKFIGYFWPIITIFSSLFEHLVFDPCALEDVYVKYPTISSILGGFIISLSMSRSEEINRKSLVLLLNITTKLVEKEVSP